MFTEYLWYDISPSLITFYATRIAFQTWSIILLREQSNNSLTISCGVECDLIQGLAILLNDKTFRYSQLTRFELLPLFLLPCNLCDMSWLWICVIWDMWMHELVVNASDEETTRNGLMFHPRHKSKSRRKFTSSQTIFKGWIRNWLGEGNDKTFRGTEWKLKEDLSQTFYKFESSAISKAGVVLLL